MTAIAAPTVKDQELMPHGLVETASVNSFTDFVSSNINETVENKENVFIDLCFNMSQEIEKIDYNKTSDNILISKFNRGVDKIKNLGFKNIKTRIVEKDEFYFHADYRRDLNYNYCKKVDYVMWGETDSFFPREAFQVIETLSKYTNEQNIHRYLFSFSDR